MHITKQERRVRRRPTVRFRNWAPARTYDSKIWTLGSENRWGITAAHRRHRLPASASPVRPCRELRGCAGQSRQILAMAVKAQVTAAPVSCPRSGGPGAGSRAIVWCRAVYRIPPGPGRGHRLDTVRAPAADAGRRQARAVPVAPGVAAGAAVFEGDAVFAAPAPGRHGASLALVGTIMVTTAVHAQALPDSSGPEAAGRVSDCRR